MECNVGKIDRVIRVILAIGLFSIFFFAEGNLKYLAAIGFIPLVTSALSFCPLYKILGIKTCK